jgi:DNA polymerase-4
MESIESALEEILDILIRRMEKSETRGKTLTLKIKYSDFKQITRSKTIPGWITGRDKIRSIYLELLKDIEIREGIRLLGLTLSNLNHEISGAHDDKSDPQLMLGF